MRTLVSAAVVAFVAAVSFAAPAPATTTDWLDSGVTKNFSNTEHTRVVDLRYAAHERFDRVVIDLRGDPRPDYRTGYARRFTQDGSGNPIPIRGRSGLWIGISADAHDRRGENLYTGPRIARPRLGTLRALAIAGDFEGQVTFVFALRHRASYRIQHLRAPSRLVIDFRHR